MTVDIEERPVSVEAAEVVEAEPAVVQRDSGRPWARWVGVALAAVAMLLAIAAGYLKWQCNLLKKSCV